MKPMPLEVSPEDWLEAAIDQIHLLARTHRTFTSDDLRPLIAEPPHCNLWGSAFRIASHRRIIAYLAHRRSGTRSRRGGSVAVWTAHPALTREEAGRDCA